MAKASLLSSQRPSKDDELDNIISKFVGLKESYSNILDCDPAIASAWSEQHQPNSLELCDMNTVVEANAVYCRLVLLKSMFDSSCFELLAAAQVLIDQKLLQVQFWLYQDDLE